MNQDLGLKVLGQIMNWTDSQARQEFAWLKLMARLKYDSYQAFQAGMRFIENLVTWLQQFKAHERATAYSFVRRSLVYIGPIEMQRLVEQFYPRTVREHIVRLVAAEYGMQPYRVLADSAANAATERLRRQTLFMGLSDGARIDTIRHANSGLLTNEQFVQVTQVDSEKWKDLIDTLRSDLNEPEARFRLVYLVDDFAGTGTSFLRFDGEQNKWKGKLTRFMDSVRIASSTLPDDRLFEENCVLCVHHYVASSDAAGAINDRLRKSTDVFPDSWRKTPQTSFGMVLPPDLPIQAGSGVHDEFIRLTKIYYDPIIQTKHTEIGGVSHLGLGYGACALPLVLEHNTPNNAIALLWAETDGGDRGNIQAPAMRALFRRRQRHL